MSVADYALAAVWACEKCPEKDKGKCDVIFGETCDRVEEALSKIRNIKERGVAE